MGSGEPLVTGIPASPGVTAGKVVLVDVSGRDGEVPEGAVLVAQYATPLLIPQLLRAQALVTDVGGAMSHAATIAREFGIPCIVGTGNATSVLVPEQYVIVDGNRGCVYEPN